MVELMRNTYSYTILVCGLLITTLIVHVRHTADLRFSQAESKLGAVSLKQGCRGCSSPEAVSYLAFGLPKFNFYCTFDICKLKEGHGGCHPFLYLVRCNNHKNQ